MWRTPHRVLRDNPPASSATTPPARQKRTFHNRKWHSPFADLQRSLAGRSCGFFTIRRRFLTQGGCGFCRGAAGRWLDQPVAVFFFLAPQPFKKPMHVVAFLRAQLIPDAPDFLDGIFLFHTFRLPLTPGACKGSEAQNLGPNKPRTTSARSWRCECAGSSRSAESPSHARSQTQCAPRPGWRAAG